PGSTNQCFAFENSSHPRRQPISPVLDTSGPARHHAGLAMSELKTTNTGWGGSAAGHDHHAAPPPPLPTQNINVAATQSLVYPSAIKAELPASAASTRVVLDSRETLQQIIA